MILSLLFRHLSFSVFTILTPSLPETTNSHSINTDTFHSTWQPLCKKWVLNLIKVSQKQHTLERSLTAWCVNNLPASLHTPVRCSAPQERRGNIDISSFKKAGGTVSRHSCEQKGYTSVGKLSVPGMLLSSEDAERGWLVSVLMSSLSLQRATWSTLVTMQWWRLVCQAVLGRLKSGNIFLVQMSAYQGLSVGPDTVYFWSVDFMLCCSSLACWRVLRWLIQYNEITGCFAAEAVTSSQQCQRSTLRTAEGKTLLKFLR